MKLTFAGRLLWIESARREEPYWYHNDKGGNRCRLYLALERVTAREDGLLAWCVIVGRWKWTVG